MRVCYVICVCLFYRPPLGGVPWWVCFWFYLGGKSQAISEERVQVAMLNWKNFGEKRKGVQDVLDGAIFELSCRLRCGCVFYVFDSRFGFTRIHGKKQKKKTSDMRFAS